MTTPTSKPYDPAMPRAVVDYTNHAGKRRERTIAPIPGSLRHGVTPYHPDPTFLFDAWDVEQDPPAFRTFALAGIHAWRRA